MKGIHTAALTLSVFLGVSMSAPAFYTVPMGLKGIRYSSSAYCKYETIDDWQCGIPCTQNSGLESVKRIHNPVRNTFGYAGYNSKDDEIVLAFRGTNGLDLENWISNIQVFMRPYPNALNPKAEVHSGFYQAYSDVRA